MQCSSGAVRALGLGMGMALASLSATSSAEPAPDSRLHPAEVRVLDLDRGTLKEVVPGKVYMRHWFGTAVSVALFRIPAGQGGAARPALHSHGTELAVQVAGDSKLVDAAGREYPVRAGDVYLIRAGVPHTGDFGSVENVILSVVTPPRPEYPAEDGTPYFPGTGTPNAQQAPSVPATGEPTVRTLFNLNDVAAQLQEIVPGQLYFKHWHGPDVTVAVTRMVRSAHGHFPPKVNVHGEEVALAVKGNLDMSIDGKPYHVAQGQALIIPPQVPHTGKCLDGECLLLSWFTPSRVDEWGPEGNTKPDLRFLDKK